MTPISTVSWLLAGDQWYRVAPPFHRRLRCRILIDLKLGRFSHADAGQMNLYLNYAREHWSHADEDFLLLSRAFFAEIEKGYV
jgi:hypothetical protein